MVLVDFDGTACLSDVGNLLFKQFASDSWLDVVESWKRGEIDSRECLLRESALARCTEKQLEEFVAGFELAPGFVDFAQSCRDRLVPLVIVSDGFDFYITRLLARNKLEWLPYRANRLVFTGPDTFTAEFPYHHLGCGLCGNCKFHHLRASSLLARRVIFIGDGYSDRFTAPAADMVFARQGRDLEKMMRKMGLPYHHFEDFSSIRKTLFHL